VNVDKRALVGAITPVAMAEKEQFESLTGVETDVQIEERTRHAMESYFNWLHNAILASQYPK